VNLLNLLLPDCCAACAKDISPGGPAICCECRTLARALDPAPTHEPRKGHLRLHRAAFRYAPPLPKILHAFKYDSNRRVGVGLGALMSARWKLFPELGLPHALVPIPLHPRKQRTRGFNQSQILADQIGRNAGLPVLSLLRRRTNDPPQALRARDSRNGRLNRAFEGIGGDLSGARLVLIDDVTTSGETLRVAAKALMRKGAKDIRAYVLAMGFI